MLLRLLLGLSALTLILIFLIGGSPFQAEAEEKVEASIYPSRQALRLAARRADHWLFVYSAGSPADSLRYQQMLAPFEEDGPRNTTVIVRPLTDTPDSLLGQYPLVLLGTNWPESWLKRLSQLPGVGLKDSSFTLGEESFDKPDDLLKLMFAPNPWQLDMPVSMLTANSDSALISFVEREYKGGLGNLFWSSWGYEVFRSRHLRYLGFFADSTWVLDGKLHYAFEPEAILQNRNEFASILSHDGAETDSFSDRLLQQHEARYLQIKAFARADKDVHIPWYFYPSVERKALRTRNMQQAHCPEDEAVVHLVHNKYFRGEEWGEQYRPLLRGWLGRPATQVLEDGLLLYFSDQIRGRHWREWAARLIHSNSLPPLHDLLDNDQLEETRSSLLTCFAGGLLVDFLVAEWGDAFVDQYPDWKLTNTAQIRQLEGRWQQWLAENYSTHDIASAPYSGADLRGFTLAHEGYRIFNGYGSALARASLDELQQVGTNAIAIVPYSFMRNARRATPIPVVDNAGTENDEAVLFSHFSAQDLGQFTLLKPQVWIGNGWPGDVDFDTEAEYDQFFNYYEAWIKHYAFLSELYRVDALCIGTELVNTTIKYPDRWRALIRDIRRIYSGTLTYAANWGRECEQLAFWQDLDFIGVNCYYPLHRGETANEEELQAGLQQVFTKLAGIQEKAGRPMWFTEVGFRSAAEPWRNPHAEAEDRPIDEAAQAQCYRLMLEQVRQTPWLQGLFWWKWPSYLHHDEDDGRGYHPYGKQAGEVLQDYYQNWE